MQQYQNAAVNAQTGLPLVGASVQVNNYPSGTPATIYSDNGITQTSNPLTTDSNGHFSFYAANGHYQLVISGSGITTQTINDILLMDITSLPTSLPASTGVVWDNGGVISTT